MRSILIMTFAVGITWTVLYLLFSSTNIHFRFDDNQREPVVVGDMTVHYTTAPYIVNLPKTAEQAFCNYLRNEPTQDPTLTISYKSTESEANFKLKTDEQNARITLNGGIVDPQAGFATLDLRYITFSGDCSYEEWYGILAFYPDKLPYTLDFPVDQEFRTVTLLDTHTGKQSLLLVFPMNIETATSDWNGDSISDYTMIEPVESQDFRSRLIMWDVIENKPADWFHEGNFVYSEMSAVELDENLESFIFSVERDQLKDVYRYQYLRNGP